MDSEQAKPGRVMLLEGEDLARKGTRKLSALTKCEITFSDEEKLQACAQALREADAQQKRRPEQMILSNWNSAYREGMKVYIEVAWYDRKFFESRKDIWKDATHAGIFRSFDAAPEDFKIEHEVVAEAKSNKLSFELTKEQLAVLAPLVEKAGRAKIAATVVGNQLEVSFIACNAAFIACNAAFLANALKSATK